MTLGNTCSSNFLKLTLKRFTLQTHRTSVCPCLTSKGSLYPWMRWEASRQNIDIWWDGHEKRLLTYSFLGFYSGFHTRPIYFGKMSFLFRLLIKMYSYLSWHLNKNPNLLKAWVCACLSAGVGQSHPSSLNLLLFLISKLNLLSNHSLALNYLCLLIQSGLIAKA